MVARTGASWREELWRLFERDVFDRSSAADQFNPYADVNEEVDCSDAPSIRRSNLLEYLRRIGAVPEVVVVAEAPGPWGCRFTGVPITSEVQLADPNFPIRGSRTSLRESPHAEYSAGIFWRVMLPYFPRFVVWNALPFHPYRQGEYLSIRTPRVGELRAFAGVTDALVRAIGPRLVVALGRKAEQQLEGVGIVATYVRHPSQGGAVAFEKGMQAVFGG